MERQQQSTTTTTKVYSFGYSKHGQLGVPPRTDPVFPTEVDVGGYNIKAVSCGGAYTSLVTTGGEVITFGDMRGHAPHRELVWKNMSVKKIVSSAMFDLALLNNGNVFMWGKLNPSETATFALPKKLEVPAGFGLWTVKYVDLAAGALHALLISTDGDLYAFGANDHGQLGIGETVKEEVTKPVRVPFESGIKIAAVACGGNHSVVLSRDGRVWAFGSNRYGQLGLSQRIEKESIPTPLNLPVYAKCTTVACGDYHSFIVCGGKLMAFGRNHCGQLGLGDLKDRFSPSTVPALESYEIMKIAANGGFGCSYTLVLVKVGLGMLYSFGSGTSGRLGYPLSIDNEVQLTPKPVPAFEKKIVMDFACGWMHSIVLVEDENRLSSPPPQQPLTFSFGYDSSATLGLFTSLPTDLYRLIFTQLGAAELSRLGSVSKFFMLASNDNLLWKDIATREYPRIYNPHNTHWKLVYTQYKGRVGANVQQGGFFSSFLSLFKSLSSTVLNIEGRVMMLGLDAAGKTTILYKMKIGEIDTTIPTIGFNVEQVTYKKVSFCCWDVGGPDKIRPLWRHYFQDMTKFIFVVDSNDRGRIDEAGRELSNLLVRYNDVPDNIPVLVFANKQDLPNAMSVAEVAEKMGLHSLRRKWFIQASCATSGDGLWEGFEWLAST